MFLVWIGVALLIARWFELGPLAEVSWWWVLSPLAVAFVWFELIESRFGFDKHKQHEDADRARRDRVAAQFKTPGSKRASR
ncbi:MAG: TIGR04438 family Trp-rich protein [Burkholderiaceae bacterium]|jgi:small Trp-rich protein|nr:TIGR04438 family Trp-rich protein [Burkholderiaceae bacterium]MCO5120810.1 TIGR04438 family Trp-rich protein [Burkholderiaceae bacterium]MEB2320139.1 TIGR04438 family Trp-rich protein [Pseudomonadota bacterium]